MRFLLVLFCITAVAVAAEPSRLGLYVNEQGVLCRDGRPYRAIGINYYQCFEHELTHPGARAYEPAFRVLADHHIPFIRFMACGYWPREMKLYMEDKEAYFRILDDIVRTAERHDLGLIPSLFWSQATLPDLVGEHLDAWGNPGSRTMQFMRTYTREVVTRYKDSPAIWGWEFGNEYNLAADLPNASEHRPPVYPHAGTATTRSTRDDLSHAMIRTAFAEFAREVRRHDPHRRILSTGNSFPRPSAWHQMHEKSWKRDTPEQYEQMLLGDNPDPVDVLSVHAYDHFDFALSLQIAARSRKPLFVGEFGVPGHSAEAQATFTTALKQIEDGPVPLAAVWNYGSGGAGPDSEWAILPTGQRFYQLKAIANVNTRLRR